MSAPVPLNSGCCAPPCPSNPQTAVPGPAGENAFSFTTANFTQPAVGSNVVVALTHSGWLTQGQVIFVQGGGYYQVITVSGLNVTLDNLGNSGNSSPGTIINAGAQVSPGGTGGQAGNAYTTISAGFTQPAVNSTVNVQVVVSSWAAVGQVVFIATGGYYSVFSIPDGTHITVTNLGYPGNAAPAANVTSPQAVSPGGLQGATGATGVSTLNGISPTTTKGDLIVDNGSNHPAASDVRLAVGTNGQLLGADSTQPTGTGWKTVTPNTAATSGDIAIFNGTTGTPMALQDSKMLITADGALQSTPSGGNARGSKAVDLQVTRTGNAMVASGTNSGVLSGESNTASATDAVVCGGSTNSATAAQSTVGAGFTNTAGGIASFVGGGSGNSANGLQAAVGAGLGNNASNTNSFIGGGTTNTASGNSATVAGGNNNTASADNSAIAGGIAASAYLYGQVAHANGLFATQGDAQASDILYRIATTDATAGVEMFLDGSALRGVVPLNTAWAFIVRLIGRSSAGVCAVWETKGGIQNNANTVSLIAANTQTVVVDGTGGSWGVTANFAVTADNTNKSLKLAVTGAVATSIRWVARVALTEVHF